MVVNGSLLAWSLMLAPPGAAPVGVAPQADRGPGFSVALDSVFSLMHGDVGTSSTVRLGVRPRPHLEVSGTLGVAHQQYAQQTGPTIAETRASNVKLGVRWVQDDPGRKHHVYVGLSLVIPTDIDGEATPFQTQLSHDVMAMRGGWDFWLWLPSTTAVVLPFGWRHNGQRGSVGLDGAVAGLAHVNGAVSVGGQLRIYGGVAVGRSMVGLYGSGAVDGLNGVFALGSGAFVHAPLCKAERQDCPLELSGTAGVGFTRTETGELQSPTVSTGLGLRWGTGSASARDD